MKITYYGHSCFVIEEAGYRIALDPYDGVPGYSPLHDIEANEASCSHGHGDHNYVEALKLIPKDGSPFKITKIESFHDDRNGALRGPNTIRIFEAGGIKLVHFGDIGCRPTDEQMKQLAGLDVALIPVGGHFTIDAKQAKALCDELKPGVIIPMHYRLGECGYPVIAELSAFTDLCNNVKYIDGNSAEVKGGEKDQVWVLKW